MGASRTIFFDLRILSGRGSVNGGLRMPSLGVTMNFWFVTGMEKSLEMRVERSATVDSGGKFNVCGVA